MFNPRQYGIAQGSLIAKSIHQEDLQCNESSVRGRRKAVPPRIASAVPRTFSHGRGGRGAGRGGRGFVRGRGGGAGTSASSRAFHNSRPQAPNSSYPSSAPFHPQGSHHVPSQSRSWKGKAVMPTADDENPRPVKRRRVDSLFSGFEPPYAQGSHFPAGGGEEVSTRPTTTENVVSTPTTARNVNLANPPVTSLITSPNNSSQPLLQNSFSNAKTLADQRDGNFGSSQRISQKRFDRLPPHIATHPAIATVNNRLSTTPAWLPQAMKQKWDFSQNEQSNPAEILTDPAPTVLYNTETPSSRISIAKCLPPTLKATPSYRPPRVPPAIDERSGRPQSSSNMLNNDAKVPAPSTSTTDASSPCATSRLFPRLPPAPKAMMSTYKGPQRPQPKSIEPSLAMPLPLLPQPSDVHQIASALTHVKKELSPPLPFSKESPVASSPAQIKSENVESFMTEDHRGSTEVKIKQEPDSSESIIPQRKLVTESCSFFPIPQNCRKSAPNYKNNRIEYFRKEYKRLREFGLTKQKVVFRDDGLAIEWTSPIPVWSDTLLPETSA